MLRVLLRQSAARGLVATPFKAQPLSPLLVDGGWAYRNAVPLQELAGSRWPPWRLYRTKSQKSRASTPHGKLKAVQSRSKAAGVAKSGFAPDIRVDVAVEGAPLPENEHLITSLKAGIGEDAVAALKELATHEKEAGRGFRVPGLELSMVLCDDAVMTELNGQYRGKDGPTDVLSFPIDDYLPREMQMRILGDVVISLDTAARQAAEREYSLRDECRVLLVHGLLHLVGYDHEEGEAESARMAAAEKLLLSRLGWQGLITEAEAVGAGNGDSEPSSSAWNDPTQSSDVRPAEEAVQSVQGSPEDPPGSSNAGTPGGAAVQPATGSPGDPTWRDLSAAQVPVEATAGKPRRQARRDIKLVALDMDGTLLDSRSQVLPSSVEVLKAALAAGIRVCLATGKARPAAMRALSHVGLSGDGLVVSRSGPGIFLQGLAVHCPKGSLLEGSSMDQQVVEKAFMYSQENGIPLCAFLGDHTATLKMTDELRELHERYYEPLPDVVASLEELLAGPPVKKLLFMTDPAVVDAALKPFWQAECEGTGAEVMQAVPNMLELVPRGVNKWVGMQSLLPALGLSPQQVMACGDGGNDLQLVANVGLGVAMRNAVPEVLEAADAIVASNDDGGIAEAFEKFVL